MRSFCPAVLILALSIAAPASTFLYTDQINDTFASTSYSLTADNNKTITFSSFGDGNSTTSGLETPDKPNMFEPDSGSIFLAPGDTLVSAVYNLSYAFTVTSPRTLTDTDPSKPSHAQTDPTFTAQNDNLQVTLSFKDINGVTLDRVNVTSLSSPLDLLPYLMGLAGPDSTAVENAFDTTGIFLKTRIRVDDVVFSADLSSYDPANNPDRNVEIDYNVKEKLSATSSLSLEIVPEPASLGLLGLGLAALVGLRRVRKTA